MLTRSEIAALIPHQGAMCLLDGVESWTRDRIVCRSRTHLAPENPLRADGRLGMVCGCEYGFQAAALHGALLAGGVALPAGYVVGLRVDSLAGRYLDEPGFGALRVEAEREAMQASGLIYGFCLFSGGGEVLLRGRGVIALPDCGAA